MSTICRKDCHMGKGKKSHSQSDCTYFLKKKKLHVKYWLDSSPASRVLAAAGSAVSRGEEASVRARLRRRNGRGRGGSKGGKLLFLFFGVGRESENHAFTQHGY